MQTDDRDIKEAPAAERSSRWASAALLAGSLLLSCLVVEVGFRVATGLPIFRLANWRTDHVVMVNLGELKAIPDPVLGWTTRASSYHEDGYTTLEHGVRKNFDETGIRTGAILAAGDSFTEGWEVKDHESWPAYLEKLAGAAVVNAGAGGYGADQTILRAEQLLPIVKPKILLLGFHEAAITRVGYSIFGAPKPYFTIENGEPRYHPPKFIDPREQNTLFWNIVHGIREVVGYSALADYLFARLNPNFWYGKGADDLYRKVDIDEAAVTCALLRRLKATADREDVRLMLLLQYYAPLVLSSDKAGPNSQAVAACARAAGIRVVDQFASLRAIVLAGPPNIIREYYWYYNGIFGHMTAKGNEQAANLIYPVLRDWLPAIRARSSQSRATAPDAANGAPQP